MLKHKLNPIIKILISLFIFVMIVLIAVRCYFRLPVSDYYRASEKSFVIPGTNDGFVAQGIEYDSEHQFFIVTGYMKDGSASPVYLVKPDGHSAEKTVLLAKPDGLPYSGHAGGIALYNGRIYVADGADVGLYVYDYQSILGADDNESVSALGFLPTSAADDSYIKPSFVSVYNDKLFVGEFYRDIDYPTPEQHKITTSAGDYQQALGALYVFDENCDLGLNMAPECIYTLPDQAQGICFDNGRIYVSTSWGISKSHILVYDESSLQRQDDIDLLGSTLPLYSLDSAALICDKEIAPMSEEIVILGGRMYVMCESASNKYIFGKFTSAKWCYATDISFFE